MHSEATNARGIPSKAELERIAFEIGPALEPVELVGMALSRASDLKLSDAEAWQLTAFADDAESAAAALREYASSIRQQVERGVR